MDSIKIVQLSGHSDEQAASIFDSCWHDVETSVLMHNPMGYRRVVNWLDIAPHASAVAYSEGEAAGIVLTGFREPERGYIASLAVKAESRGKGIGRRLMNWAITRARIIGCRKIGLHVFESNDPAIRLYSALGFARKRMIGHWEGHIRAPISRPMEFSNPEIGAAQAAFVERTGGRLWENELRSLRNLGEGIITVLAKRGEAPFGYMAYSTRSLCWILDMCFVDGTTSDEAAELLYSIPTAKFLPAVFTTLTEGSDNERIVRQLGLKLQRRRIEMELLMSSGGPA